MSCAILVLVSEVMLLALSDLDMLACGLLLPSGWEPVLWSHSAEVEPSTDCGCLFASESRLGREVTASGLFVGRLGGGEPTSPRSWLPVYKGQ